MQRVTITIDDELDAELDRFMKARSYANRSEAIRDLARVGLQQAALEVGGTRPCVAALVYMYDHEARDLPKRLTRDFHHRHDLAQTTLHLHLDHDNCMEVTVLKGRGSDVQEFADHIIAERGVRHGHVVYLPADGAHSHGHDGTPIIIAIGRTTVDAQNKTPSSMSALGQRATYHHVVTLSDMPLTTDIGVHAYWVNQVSR